MTQVFSIAEIVARCNAETGISDQDLDSAVRMAKQDFLDGRLTIRDIADMLLRAKTG